MRISSALIISSCLFESTKVLAAEESNDKNNDDDFVCRLWLGPSTTSTQEEPKLGLYAGKDYNVGDLIGSPEFGIPLVDFSEPWNRQDQQSDLIMEFLEGYLWTSDFSGSKWEGNHSTTVVIPGFGILAQYHSGTYNIDWQQSSVLLREPLTANLFTPQKPHPARGAITPYYNFTMKATQIIPAGMELFANFGDVWDGNSTKKDVFQEKLTRWDYQDADKILDAILEFMEKYKDEMDETTKDEVLDFILFKVLGTAAGSHAKVIRSLIPAHPGKLQTVKDMGGTFAYRNPDLVKTPKWMRKHATCVDNMEVKASTIPEAGRGAFARRTLKRGDVITPVPLLHIADESLLEMYDIVQQKSQSNGRQTWGYDDNAPRGHQLVMNYCFGHPQSSMLFMPVSSLVTQINHGGLERSNARLTWSKNKYWGNAHDLHDMSPSDMADYHHVSAIMELYATRDIEPGEEILIDYGRDWEAAWQEYMENEYDAEAEWPLRADDLKEEYQTQKPYKTGDEISLEPYPQSVGTACFVESKFPEDGSPKVNAQDQEIVIWTGPNELDNYHGIHFYECMPISRVEDPVERYNYTVIAFHQGVGTQVEQVPHRAIQLVDKPYQGDIHVEGAFRHWIGLPDASFPQAWRDLMHD